MPIQDSDLLLIESTSGVSNKIEASKLKANLAANTYNNYKLLVNKPDYTSRFVYAQNMQQSVAPTDYMLVERAGVSYKVNGQQIIDYFPSVPAGAAGPITDVATTKYEVIPLLSPDVTRSPADINDDYKSANVVYYSPPNLRLDFYQGWDMRGVAKVKVRNYSDAYGLTFYFTDINGNRQSVSPANNGVGGPFDLSSIDFTIPISTIELLGSRGALYFWGFYDSSNQGFTYPNPPSTVLTLASDTNLDLFTAGDAINMVDEDGAVVSYSPVTSEITSVSGNTLSFASPNQDLKYFKPGDGIGQNATVISTDTSSNNMVVSGGVWSDGSSPTGSGTWLDGATSTGPVQFDGDGGFTKMFDGVLETNPDHATVIWYGGSEGSYVNDSVLTFNPPITSVSKVQFWGYLVASFMGDGASTCVLIDGNGTEHNSGLPVYRQNETVGVLGREITPVNGIVAIKVKSIGHSGQIAGVYFDDELPVWLAADKVIGLPRSGTGNFISNTGPVVDLSNSNYEWLYGTNRLGKSFFIKPASTRTGLAILRTKAIEAATAIVQAKEDIGDGEFAIVDDNYWFRDEDTFIDLGPINLPSK